MNILSRNKQIEIVAALCEGVGQRAAARLADVDRKTVARLALHVGKGCAELHDRRVVGLRVARVELDEVWSFVGKKQKRVERHEAFAKGDTARRWKAELHADAAVRRGVVDTIN